MIEIDIYDSRDLTLAIDKTKAIEPFVLSKLFKSPEMHSSDKIDVEILTGGARLAQFVNAEEKAKPTVKLNKNTQTITLPRTFEKKVFTVTDLANYKSVGNIYTANSNDRVKLANQWVIKELTDLKNRVKNRREQMACEILSTGQIVVNQDNIAFSMDFGYTSEQLVTLQNNDLWTADASNPIKNLRAWKMQIGKLAGVNADTLILGEEAADAFLANQKVIKALDTNNYKVGGIDLNSNTTASGLFIGRIMGIDIYIYNQQYTDSDGNSQDMIPSTKAILVASQAPFRLHSGPIYRIDRDTGELKAYNVDMFVDIGDGSGKLALEWECEQKSLPVPHDPTAVVSATVVAS